MTMLHKILNFKIHIIIIIFAINYLIIYRGVRVNESLSFISY